MQIELTTTAPMKSTDAFYSIADTEKWVLGETLERAVAALQREIDARGRARSRFFGIACQITKSLILKPSSRSKTLSKSLGGIE
jgi:hypothetical protein